ncbi:unnamed protein product [Caenorhabditis auriculariae]|uniref:Uncharacterized protein n=1 Tax=Caenorhabditis auriculariae TaxID=2777116 RepID=A0A8S1HLQ2_9PELO|nr:unnamed protein product [Caenorhabditis auriculariae]
MFYACMAILLLFMIMCSCVTLAIIDLEMYNFGLYIVFVMYCWNNVGLCPLYSQPTGLSESALVHGFFCLLLHEHMQEMYPVPQEGSSSPKMSGLRAQMRNHVAQSTIASDDGTRATVRNESRATVAMLAPAVHIMHQVWKGMAWVTDGIEEEDEDTRMSQYDKMEQGTSDETRSNSAVKRLSTIAESSSCILREILQDETNSSEINSRNDVNL